MDHADFLPLLHHLHGPQALPPRPDLPPDLPPALGRRQWLALCTGATLGTALPVPAAAAQPPALPRRTLQFPRDHGAHPDLRTEWWYMTGQALAEGGRRFGFQVTFFRSRVDGTQALRSAFAARQLIFAHAALTDLQGQRLWHDQRIARAAGSALDQAGASLQDTDVRLRDWRLVRSPQDGSYRATVQAEGFALQLHCAPTQPLLLQGDQGLSRKGPAAAQASYYVSEPQLAVRGTLRLGGSEIRIAPGPGSRAWLDHEWSEALLHPEAVGWDWIGMNLDDGSALTAFRLRRADGSSLWAGGSWRPAGGTAQAFAADTVRFVPQRHWRSPASDTRYPVQWQVETPAGLFEVRALLDDQELDSRASTGAIYWEGLSALHDAQGRAVGSGYLEMTGYASALRL